MTLKKIFAQLNCTDMDASAAWFRKLFGRREDADPMAGLKEWHHEGGAGVQLVTDPDGAGHGRMTLIVDDLEGERARMIDAGLQVGDVVVGDFASFLRIADPDGNMVVLAEPGTA